MAANWEIEIMRIFVQYGREISYYSRNPIPSPQLTAIWKEIVFRVDRHLIVDILET